MMSVSQLRAVRSLATEVARLAEQVEHEFNEVTTRAITGTKTSGELRRRSMDLTRALAELRRP